MERTNPFEMIYKQCNSTTNYEKYIKHYNVAVDVPAYLDVELTNCCNIRCNMCPVGSGTMKRPKGFMSEEVFTRIVENIKKYPIQGIRFIRWGEPMLHPNFFDWGGVLKRENILVHFNTNGLLFNDEAVEKILRTGIDSVKFSFQGINSLTYSEMRSGGNYLQLIDAIKQMYRMRGEKEKPYISITTSVTYESEQEIEQFKTNVSPYCDEVSVGKTKMQHVDIERMNLSAERRKIYERFMKEDKGQMRHVSVCPEIWDKLSINWDGSVSACCQDFDNMMIVGNILENDLPEIFSGNRERQYREVLKDDNYDVLPLCQNCYEYITLKK